LAEATSVPTNEAGEQFMTTCAILWKDGMECATTSRIELLSRSCNASPGQAPGINATVLLLWLAPASLGSPRKKVVSW